MPDPNFDPDEFIDYSPSSAESSDNEAIGATPAQILAKQLVSTNFKIHIRTLQQDRFNGFKFDYDTKTNTNNFIPKITAIKLQDSNGLVTFPYPEYSVCKLCKEVKLLRVSTQAYRNHMKYYHGVTKTLECPVPNVPTPLASTVECPVCGVKLPLHKAKNSKFRSFFAHYIKEHKFVHFIR